MAAKRSVEIREFLISEIDRAAEDIVRHAQDQFGISRQAINRYLRDLVAQGVIAAHGNTRNRSYSLVPIQTGEFHFPIGPDLHEDEVWREHVRPLLDGLASNVLQTCQFGFTEMLNNAVDHSDGQTVLVQVNRTAATVEIVVGDDGIGIFRKIKRELNLEDERYTLLELSKGKLTTEPDKHSGQGIFFTSRVFDSFQIKSGNLFFTHTGHGPRQDWLLEDHQSETVGTLIRMRLSVASKLRLSDVFDRFAADSDEFGFSRTIVPVALAQYGDENLISRSQAKRLLTRFDRFREVLLDFKGVDFIGQAFADEVFRVFRSEHPEVNVTWMNTEVTVESMIVGARANSERNLP